MGAVGGAISSLIDSAYDTGKEYVSAKKANQDFSWGSAIAQAAVNVGIGTAFGAASSASSAEFLKSCKISNEGMRGIGTLAKRTLGAATRPGLTNSAKKAASKMGRYCVQTFVSELKGSPISTVAESFVKKVYAGITGRISTLL